MRGHRYFIPIRAALRATLIASCMGCGVFMPTCPSIEVMRLGIDSDYYASSQVRTPDPLGPNYPEGECLVIQWNVPPEWIQPGVEVVLEILYHNHERKEQRWPVTSTMKTIRVPCLGSEFCRTQGFMTYHVAMMERGQQLLSAPHQLWFTWIDPAAQHSAND